MSSSTHLYVLGGQSQVVYRAAFGAGGLEPWAATTPLPVRVRGTVRNATLLSEPVAP